MKKNHILNKKDVEEMGIPVSVSLTPTLREENLEPREQDKKRTIYIASLAFIIGVCISFIAKILVYLINFFTNISFYGSFTFGYMSPADNSLGLWVILVPAIGGVVVGLMALYGSKAIRGHGIPEAMEQILTNQSKIKPSITFLKPLSAAVSIGSGGPFGAEGPIIATGGALGSTLGQLLKITHIERKILLAAGATAGMSAIFGSPIAAIFLAIELLLFEFSPRSILPVAVACITGAAGHHLLFEQGPVFHMPSVAFPSNEAIVVYSLIGIAVGLISAATTKIVYYVEDVFEKLPVHWMWWPAIGGLAVGIIGYFAPKTLGVGYENITDVLSGTLPIKIIVSLCLLKFTSWAIALGSGTSGGTLAPLLTIGGATGAILGSFIIPFFPESGASVSVAALVGMSAMFAGASRALLTSIVFALETTFQSNALLPLLAACTASYFVSFFLMKNTIMTEKIARRGVITPDSYEPDILERIAVGQVLKDDSTIIHENDTIGAVRELLKKEPDYLSGYLIVVDDKNILKGIISSGHINSFEHDNQKEVGSIVGNKSLKTIRIDCSLKSALELMAKNNLDVLTVVSHEDKNIIEGVLSYKEIINAYKMRLSEYEMTLSNNSFKRVLFKGQRLVAGNRRK